jgi:hypothetical protein
VLSENHRVGGIRVDADNSVMARELTRQLLGIIGLGAIAGDGDREGLSYKMSQ